MKETLLSVVAQTYGNWEIWLADSSRTNRKQVAYFCQQLAKADDRIHYLPQAVDLGTAANLNAAAAAATGAFKLAAVPKSSAWGR